MSRPSESLHYSNFANGTTGQAVTHSNDQSINQPNQLSPFELMTTALLCVTCSYLRLDEKCSRLPLLSRTMNQSFNRSANKCCHGYVGFTSMNVDALLRSRKLSLIDERQVALIRYIEYASNARVVIDATSPAGKRRSDLMSSMRKALVTGAMKSLMLTETSLGAPEPLITTELFAALNKPQIRLRELLLCLHDRNFERRVGFWGALKECKTLRKLMIGMNNTIIDESIIPHLPNSLQEIMILSDLGPTAASKRPSARCKILSDLGPTAASKRPSARCKVWQDAF